MSVHDKEDSQGAPTNDALLDELEALKSELECCQERERKLRFLLDAMPFQVAYIDDELRYQFNNAQYAPWSDTGDTLAFLGEEVSDVIGAQAMDEIQEHIHRALEGDEVTYSGVVRYQAGERDIELRYVPDRNGGAVRGFGAMVENRTAQRRREERLREAATVFEASRDAILVMNHRFQVVRVNRALTELTGYTAEEAVGSPPWILTSPGRRDILDKVWKSLRREGHWQGELWHRHKDGSLNPVWVNVNALENDDGLRRYVAVITDLRAETTLPHLAHHDALTGLPNRLLLEARLEHTLARAQRAEEQAAILFFDLDGFKAINDGWGHAEGDSVLRSVAKRLKNMVRAEDTVARLGGDEFIMILEAIDEADAAIDVARRVLEHFREPIRVGTRMHHVGTSIGIALYPDHGDDTAELLACADRAMYASKRGGKGRVEVYGPAFEYEAPLH